MRITILNNLIIRLNSLNSIETSLKKILGE